VGGSGWQWGISGATKWPTATSAEAATATATSAHPFNRKTCAAFLGFARGGGWLGGSVGAPMGGGRSLSGCGPRFWPEVVYRRSDSNGRHTHTWGHPIYKHIYTYVEPTPHPPCVRQRGLVGWVVRKREDESQLRF